MPRTLTINDDGDIVTRYLWPARYVTPAPETADALRRWRKEFVVDQEDFTRYKKTCGRDDTNGARFFKEEANRALRLQRACTLMIPWFGEPDKGQEATPSQLWPIGLVDELDMVSGRIIIAFG